MPLPLLACAHEHDGWSRGGGGRGGRRRAHAGARAQPQRPGGRRGRVQGCKGRAGAKAGLRQPSTVDEKVRV
eukprot:scaffold25318_cov117-Isochrysis_galbana.AAC.7